MTGLTWDWIILCLFWIFSWHALCVSVFLLGINSSRSFCFWMPCLGTSRFSSSWNGVKGASLTFTTSWSICFWAQQITLVKTNCSGVKDLSRYCFFFPLSLSISCFSLHLFLLLHLSMHRNVWTHLDPCRYVIYFSSVYFWVKEYVSGNIFKEDQCLSVNVTPERNRNFFWLVQNAVVSLRITPV